MTINVLDVEAIPSQVVLTNEIWAKSDTPLVAEVKGRAIVGKNVSAEDWWGFAECNVVLVNVFCQVKCYVSL